MCVPKGKRVCTAAARRKVYSFRRAAFLQQFSLYKKPAAFTRRVIKALSLEMVEISGIEPLTS